MLQLDLKIRPVPHQSVRKGKYGFFQPKTIGDYKKAIRYLSSEQIPNDFKMFTKDIPLKVHVIYYFEYRKGEPKKNRDKLIPRITKPDLTDNTNKALIDALSKLVYEQDQQICYFLAEKYWWKEDGIRIGFKEFKIGI